MSNYWIRSRSQFGEPLTPNDQRINNETRFRLSIKI